MRNKGKTKLNDYKTEKGVTLVALIITIIILVILSAVSISAAYKSKIIDYAIEGAQKYATEGINENKVMEGTEELIESAINTIKEIGITGGDTGPSEGTDPKPDENIKDELAKTENIGKYIDYQPAGSDYTVNGTYSGTGSNQIFSANNDMKWRIWGVEGDKLLIISETLAGNIVLSGIEGYNNGIKILNDACAQAFGNSTTYGDGAVVARSINQEDIDKVTNMTTPEQRKAVYPSYNYGVSGANMVTAEDNRYYPTIYEQEPSKSGGGSLERSKQSSWYSGYVSGSSTGYVSCYEYNIANYATQELYNALLTNPQASSTTGTVNHTSYWIGSRCVYLGGLALFDIFRIDGGKLTANTLYTSGGSAVPRDNAVRPVVEIDLSKVTIVETEGGIEENTYSITKK